MLIPRPMEWSALYMILPATITKPTPSSILRLFFLMKPSPPRSPSPSPPPPPPSSLSFSSPSSLSDFLKPRIPSLSSWGLSPGSKPLHNLFLELAHGESSLILSAPDSPVRTLNVATLNIRNPKTGVLLLESHQLLSDGTVRSRNRPLSEKMKPDETVEAAAVRAVKEELGEGVVVKLREGSFQVREEERESVSYPGLPARYVLHSVEAEVEGVPEDGEFESEEGGEEVGEGGVFVKKHFWRWVRVGDLHHSNEASS